MQIDESIRPVIVAGLGIAILSCMDASMKVVSAAYPISEVVGLRYAAGTGFALTVFVFAREAFPSRATILRNLPRAVVVLLTAGCFFTAIARLPLAEAVALTFLAPLLLSVLGRIVLSEPIHVRTLVALIAGLAGVGVISAGQDFDSTKAFDVLGVAAALGAAFFYALSNVLMRKQSGTDSIFTMVALSNLFAMVFALPGVVLQWQAPTNSHVLTFLAAGLLGTCGHLCLAWSYSRSPAGRLGALEYTAFIWTSLLGYIFFSEIPSPTTLVGAAIIVLSCVFASWSRRAS